MCSHLYCSLNSPLMAFLQKKLLPWLSSSHLPGKKQHVRAPRTGRIGRLATKSRVGTEPPRWPTLLDPTFWTTGACWTKTWQTPSSSRAWSSGECLAPPPTCARLTCFSLVIFSEWRSSQALLCSITCLVVIFVLLVMSCPVCVGTCLRVMRPLRMRPWGSTKMTSTTLETTKKPRFP